MKVQDFDLNLKAKGGNTRKSSLEGMSFTELNYPSVMIISEDKPLTVSRHSPSDTSFSFQLIFIFRESGPNRLCFYFLKYFCFSNY